MFEMTDYASSQKAFTVTFIRLIVKIQLYSLIQEGIHKAMIPGIMSNTTTAKARDDKWKQFGHNSLSLEVSEEKYSQDYHYKIYSLVRLHSCVRRSIV